jgi:hypothetical protein
MMTAAPIPAGAAIGGQIGVDPVAGFGIGWVDDPGDVAGGAEHEAKLGLQELGRLVRTPPSSDVVLLGRQQIGVGGDVVEVE